MPPLRGRTLYDDPARLRGPGRGDQTLHRAGDVRPAPDHHAPARGRLKGPRVNKDDQLQYVDAKVRKVMFEHAMQLLEAHRESRLNEVVGPTAEAISRKHGDLIRAMAEYEVLMKMLVRERADVPSSPAGDRQ